jgi:hypothetical protein
MVYWADLLYAEPDAKLAAYESVGELELEAVKQEPAMEAVWLQPEDPVQEIWLRDLAAKLKVEESSPTGNDAQTPPEAEADGTFERVPLPWFVKRRFLKTFLRDVHHYLFDVEVTPRPGETYRVQDEIRRRFLNGLAPVASGCRFNFNRPFRSSVSKDSLALCRTDQQPGEVTCCACTFM